MEFLRKLFQPSKLKRVCFFILFDIITIVLSFFISFFLRFEFSFPQEYLHPFLYWVLGVLILRLLLIKIFGLYDINWRFVGVTELKNLTSVFFISTFILFSINFNLRINLTDYDIPYSVILIDLLICFTLISFLRISKRIYLDVFRPGKKGKSTLIFGANIKSERIINELRSTDSPDIHPVSIIDNNPNVIGTRINGIPVEGNISNIGKIVKKRNIETILICLPKASHKEIKNIFAHSKEAGINDIKIAPQISDYRQSINITKDIKNIEISDLLFRDPVKVDSGIIKKNLVGKTVLVTGASGSIGSEIMRALVKFGVKKIIAYEIDESGLYDLSFEVNKFIKKDQKVEYVVGDVRDEIKLINTFDQFKPDIIFHASAYKHVPLMDQFPEEAVRTNIFGTKNLAEIAVKNKVERFVNISTDKAVNPSSIMGASKRIGENICLTHKNSSTKFISVRFGNVLGSRGSVIPLFLKQIEDGGPVTITHPEMKRYFMSIPEAVLLVFQAGFLGEGGEVFVLDMGEPVKITDLAEKLIQLNNLKPYEDIEIVFNGIRPGEKLFEELLTAEEGTEITKHEKILIAKNGHNINSKIFNRKLKKLKNNLYDKEQLISILKDIVPFYNIVQTDHDPQESQKLNPIK